MKEITGATQANQCVLTVTGHGWETEQLIRIWDVAGMTELNIDDASYAGTFSPDPDDGLLYYKLTKVDANSFSLDGVNSTGFTAYSAGGFAVAGASSFELANPDVVDGDIRVTDATTSPGGYDVTPGVDGTISYAAGGDGSQQSITEDFYDVSVGALSGEVTNYYNNSVPVISTIPTIVFLKDVAFSAFELGDYVEDPDPSDTISYMLSGQPTGISISGSQIVGTATDAVGTGQMTLTATDSPPGGSANATINWEIVDEIVVSASGNLPMALWALRSLFK